MQDPAEALLEPEERVLSTLSKDGSRRWLKPKLSRGRYLQWRRLVAYLLIITYTALPFVKVGGHPLFLFDIPAREFTVFGYVFLPTDTLLLALLLVEGLLALFLLTALLGRIWCGWACPQTVYMEFVFRPLERLFEGTTGRGGTPRKPPASWRKAARFAVYLLVSFALANTFLAYFVGVDALAEWMTRSPITHPVSFSVMAVLTIAMMVHFSYFREQLCIIACPYGRLQSVLLDEGSRVVTYDASRGEPRGKKSKSLPVLRGDCVDCRLCVETCPTGIDIRDGLQMECVNCTQCMDACDRVMNKLGRKPGLVGYGYQANAEGKTRGPSRFRVTLYPVVMAVVAGLFVAALLAKQPFDAVLLRNQGQPFTFAADGRVRNVLRLKLTERADTPQRFHLQLDEGTETTIEFQHDPLEVGPREQQSFPVSVLAAPELFVAAQGRVPLRVRVVEHGGAELEVEATLLGPATLRRPQTGER